LHIETLLAVSVNMLSRSIGFFSTGRPANRVSKATSVPFVGQAGKPARGIHQQPEKSSKRTIQRQRLPYQSQCCIMQSS
jgi:hypothetical protein